MIFGILCPARKLTKHFENYVGHSLSIFGFFLTWPTFRWPLLRSAEKLYAIRSVSCFGRLHVDVATQVNTDTAKYLMCSSFSCPEAPRLRQTLEAPCGGLVNCLAARCLVLTFALLLQDCHRQDLSAPNHKSQRASDFKSRSPNRKNIPRIAVKSASNRNSNRAICDLKPLSNRSRIATPSPSNR